MNRWVRLAFLHPGWIILIWFMPFPLYFLGYGSILESVAVLLIFLTTFGWVYAIYAVSRSACSGRPDHPPDRSWVFAVPVIVVAGQVVVAEVWPAVYEALSKPPWTLLEIPFVALFTAGWWFSASAFARWKNGGPPSFDARLGWFLAFFYAPITVWVMRPHLLRLKAELDERSSMQG